jgi:hypothetical protein
VCECPPITTSSPGTSRASTRSAASPRCDSATTVAGPSRRASHAARLVASSGSLKRSAGPGEEIAGTSGVTSPTTASRAPPCRSPSVGRIRPASAGSPVASRLAQSKGNPAASA